MGKNHPESDVTDFKKKFELKISGSNDAFCSVLRQISDKYVADFILEAADKNLLSEIKPWLLFHVDTKEEFFSNHDGVISFEMVRQSMYEMANEINDEVFELYNKDGSIDQSKLEDQDSFEMKRLIEWAKKYNLS